MIPDSSATKMRSSPAFVIAVTKLKPSPTGDRENCGSTAEAKGKNE